MVGEISHPTYLSISSPMKLTSYPKHTRNGIEESLSLQRWVHFSETEVFDIPKTQVILCTGASIGLSRFYDYVVRKMNAENEDVTSFPSRRELRDIEDEENQDRFEGISNTLH